MSPVAPHPIRVLIVDDESLGRDVVRHMLQSQVDAVVVGEAANGVKALEEIKIKNPGVVFLDIKMPKMSGFDLLKALPPGPAPLIVFTTAYDEYAVSAFERNALDYLLKPFDQERFDAIWGRVRRQLQNTIDGDFGRRLRRFITSSQENAPTGSATSSGAVGTIRPLTRFTIKEAGRVMFVPVESVDWLEAAGNYLGLHVGSKTHLLHQTLAETEQMLDPAVFLRVHRSTIVNVKRIKELQPHANGEFVVILADGTRLKLSRSFRDRANELLGLRS